MYTNLLTNAVIFGDKLDATHPYGQDRLEWSLEPGSDLAWSFYGKNRSFLCCCNVSTLSLNQYYEKLNWVFF
ncbi:hypothetical protein HZ326_9780 [Fusarium oxysporum f. sp. albedinis]|nr:hypothetical protein HZ326_9780 [Fusarium oxysporum f. sp. albedinis]